jgi:hypothetical protein
VWEGVPMHAFIPMPVMVYESRHGLVDQNLEDLIKELKE